jgi:predicted adenylyl cyclase CyaB
MKNKEIELKFNIKKETREIIIRDLKTQTTLSSSLRQVDTYYIPYFSEFEINGETMECVRIREENGVNTLAYKKIHREANPIYCDEYETTVESKEQLEKILFPLGFTVQMVIDKTRESYKLGEFEFDFDSVKNMGELMEVELKSDESSVDAIYEFVSKYGLTKDDVTYEGIQVLMKKAMTSK